MSVVINPTVATVGRSVTARYFGSGDGSRVLFNLAGLDSDRAYLMPAIYLDQTLQTVTTHYTVDATGKVTFVTAPATGKVVNYKDPHAPSGNIYRAFGVGDGTSVDFSLPFVPKVPVLYRSDWQGNQLLYSTARTNYLLWSDNQSNGAYIPTNLTVSGPVADPAGGTAAYTLTATAVNGVLQQVYLAAPATACNSIWAKRRTGTGVIQLLNPDATAWTPISVTSIWTRFYVSGARYFDGTGFWSFRINDSGDAVDVAFADANSGTVPSAHQTTTTSPITITDYSYTPNGDVTLAVAPVAGALLTGDFNMGPTP